MLQCFWCGRWFRNKQALRAHLRHCRERVEGGEFKYGPYTRARANARARGERKAEGPQRTCMRGLGAWRR